MSYSSTDYLFQTTFHESFCLFSFSVFLIAWVGFFLTSISLKSLVYQTFLIFFFFFSNHLCDYLLFIFIILLYVGVIMRVFLGDETASFVFHVHENILIKFGMNQITTWLFPVWSVYQFTACKLLWYFYIAQKNLPQNVICD